MGSLVARGGEGTWPAVSTSVKSGAGGGTPITRIFADEANRYGTGAEQRPVDPNGTIVGFFSVLSVLSVPSVVFYCS